MNIPVYKSTGGIECRPDTTWERENKDFYSPDFVCRYEYSPVVFARIAKAGKCISPKFAERYYDGTGFGLLLYPDGLSYMDHTSILPMPLYNKLTPNHPGNEFVLRQDGAEIFNSREGFIDKIEAAICEASKYLTLRIGDMIAVELTECRELALPDNCILSGTFADNDTFCFRIIR